MSSDQETPGAQPDLAAPIALPGPIEPIHDTSITPLETLSRYRVVPDEKDVQPGLSTIAATKRDMRAWLNKLKKPKKQVGASEEPSPITPVVRNDLIFGAPLATSISYASVPISVQDDTGAEFVYGIIPIVVAKCGKKLKAEAITTPGIFRVNGSNKRLSDLVDVFSHPGDYGKDFNWDGFTPHDAANLLRRYLNSLPEPVVPLDFYHRFREPLRRRSEWTLYHKLQAHADQPPLDLASTVIIYQNLIVDMPALNRQLLLYLLDMLAVFATSAKDNLMPANNLAAIFQPCILSHPQHVMIPPEYRLSQDVLIFLIENQDHFLFGMSRARPQSVVSAEAVSPSPSPERITPSVSPLPPLPPSPSQRSLSLADPVDRTTGAAFSPTPSLPAPSTPARPLAPRAGMQRSASDAATGVDSLMRRHHTILRRNQSVRSGGARTLPDAIGVGAGGAQSPRRSNSARALGFLRRSNTVPTKRANGFASPNAPTNDAAPTLPAESAAPPIASASANANADDYAAVPPTAQPAILAVPVQGSSQGSVVQSTTSDQSRVRTDRSEPVALCSQEVPSSDARSPSASTLTSTQNSSADAATSVRRQSSQLSQIDAGQQEWAPPSPTSPLHEPSRLASIIHAISPPRFAENRRSRKERRTPSRLKRRSLNSVTSSPPLSPFSGEHAPLPSVEENPGCAPQASRDNGSALEQSAQRESQPRDSTVHIPHEAPSAVDGRAQQSSAAISSPRTSSSRLSPQSPKPSVNGE